MPMPVALCCTQALYRLRAVISRHESTLSGGHSSAVVYENGSWMLYDDSQVRKILALLQLSHCLPSSLVKNIVIAGVDVYYITRLSTVGDRVFPVAGTRLWEQSARWHHLSYHAGCIPQNPQVSPIPVLRHLWLIFTYCCIHRAQLISSQSL